MQIFEARQSLIGRILSYKKFRSLKKIIFFRNSGLNNAIAGDCNTIYGPKKSELR